VKSLLYLCDSKTLYSVEIRATPSNVICSAQSRLVTVSDTNLSSNPQLPSRNTRLLLPHTSRQVWEVDQMKNFLPTRTPNTGHPQPICSTSRPWTSWGKISTL